MTWRRDLYANAARHGLKGAAIGWFLNPGFAVVTLYRIMRWGHLRGGPFGRLLEKLVWRRIVRNYGCYFDPTAKIGPGLRLPHPVGIVVGADTVIGADVTVYQHVTFGRRAANEAVYPVVGDGTVIYAGAVVTGEITVGHDATIAAGALVRHDVPAHGVALPAAGAIHAARTIAAAP
ncbi:hypothetical protein ASE95_11595 [Sphingomonas sp. Leaf231]|uniref:serine O-acetyltransferase n=1 Tax=Sphingomonas sp. Leaf231 TaxID=1736301 RepID=UPI0007023662|nr:hypothetical protein [Sphingomonas sp. Leaf231]KQN90923.1 hypothetical protein ASE95_11595 [Sphingomonas sp. Leaf231]